MKHVALFALIWFFPTSTLEAKPADPMVDINAEHIEMDQKKGIVLFRGNVQVRRGPMRLYCNQLKAEYKNGELITLHAEGAVRAEREGLTIRAKSAQFDPKEKRIELTGQPTVSQGDNHLSGDRVTWWVDTEKVVVQKAKGRFDPASLKSKTTDKK